MTIVQRMRAELPGAMKARDGVRTGFLRYWIAQLTAGTGEELSDDQAVKKMRGILKEAQAGRVDFKPEELDLIRQWVPASLTADQIRELLAPVAEQVKAAPKEGQAMGIAMKHLAGQPVESDDVKQAVAAIRG